MANKFIYLFEVKSIQSYLNRTGRLKDVIAISDLLDNFINNEQKGEEKSILSLALEVIDQKYPEPQIKFIRRRGGSFYSYCENQEKLQAFRQLWLLIFYQYFPYMQHTDYLGELTSDQNFKIEVGNAFKCLNASINAVNLSLPYSTVAVEATANTGEATVDFIQYKDESPNVDLACKKIANVNDNFTKKIYKKFIAENCLVKQDPKAYDNLVNSFIIEFNKLHGDVNHDIAYVHFDGNGIGQILMELRKSEKVKSLDLYTDIMTTFSDTLAKSTQKAAQGAFKKVYEQFLNDNEQNNSKAMTRVRNAFYFRPLVLGGDDLTVMIEPKYALDFCSEFTREFKQITSQRFEELNKKYKIQEIKKEGLTASGGVLFNKIKHPASNTGAIVEALAEKAKDLTKNKNQIEKLKKHEGKSAIAFYRMSTTTQDDFDEVLERGRLFKCHIESYEQINLGRGVYFIDHIQDYPNLHDFIDFLNYLNANKKGSNNYKSVIPTFRRMMSYLSLDNFYEAKNIYQRLIKRLENDHGQDVIAKLVTLFTFTDQNQEIKEKDQFYYLVNDQKYVESPLADLLLIHHYIYEDQNFDVQDLDNAPNESEGSQNANN